MKKTRIGLILLIVLSLCIGLSAPAYAAAEKGNYMRRLKGINWDLQPGREFTYQTFYAGIGMRNQKGKITAYSIRDAARPGYKTLDLTIQVDQRWDLSKQEIAKILAAGKRTGYGGKFYWVPIDYDTGKCLEVPNPCGVTVKTIQDWTPVASTTYRLSGREGITLSRMKTSISITGPASYKGLCIGIGGFTRANGTAVDKAMFEGKVPFGMATSLYSTRYRKVAHFMCVIPGRHEGYAAPVETLQDEYVNLKEGETRTLVFPAENDNRKVSWSSSDSSVVQVNASGTVRARSTGKAVVTASCAKATKRFLISVLPKSSLTEQKGTPIDWQKSITGTFNPVGGTETEFYSDTFFDNPDAPEAVTGNTKLFKFSALASAMTYRSTPVQVLSDAGFADIVSVYTGPGSSGTSTDNDHCTIYSGEKTTSSGQHIIAVVISGYSEGAYEWLSNMNIGTGSVHEGFSKAAEEVISYIVSRYNPTSEDILWITGYSRGAAIANLVAQQFVSGHIGHVFAYGFATPNVAKSCTDTNRIYNFVNVTDLVPYLPPSYSRNGVTRNFVVNESVKMLYKLYTGVDYAGLTGTEVETLIRYLMDIAGTVPGLTVTPDLTAGGSMLLPSGTPLTPEVFLQQGLGGLLSGNPALQREGASVVEAFSQLDSKYAVLAAYLKDPATLGMISCAHLVDTYMAMAHLIPYN